MSVLNLIDIIPFPKLDLTLYNTLQIGPALQGC